MELTGRAGETWVCPRGTRRRAVDRADRLVGLRPDRSPYDQSVTDSLTRCFPPALAMPRFVWKDEGDIRPIKTRSALQYVPYDLVQVMEQPLSSRG